jgi:hypothetical protein
MRRRCFWVCLLCCGCNAETDEGEGSPNGQAAGYFLAQHKKRFGKNKTIDKVTVFRNGNEEHKDLRYILFHVIDAPPWPGAEGQDGDVEMADVDSLNKTEPTAEHEIESRVVRRSADGNSVLREHVFRARL